MGSATTTPIGCPTWPSGSTHFFARFRYPAVFRGERGVAGWHTWHARRSPRWHDGCFARPLMHTRTLWRGASLSLAAVAALSASGGCGRSDDGGGAIPIAFERKVRPRAVKTTPMRPLTPAPGAPPAAPAAAPELRLAPNLSVDARVLIITADGTEAAFEAIKDALGYLGTPYDVLDATTGPTLTAATLADG